MFSLLTGHQIAQACEVAQQSGDHRLALLLAQAGSTRETQTTGCNTTCRLEGTGGKTGFLLSWKTKKVMEFYICIFLALKVMKNYKLALNVIKNDKC